MIKYVIKENGFVYHIKKGIFKANSTISKDKHPISEVEEFKSKLLQGKMLKEKGNYYILKRNIQTGLLMAYNLHYGCLKKELPGHWLAINGEQGEDIEIKDSLYFENIKSADDEFMNKISKNSHRLEKIMRVECDLSFFERARDNRLSGIEQFVADTLIEVGELDSYRRGDANKHEADLIDENNRRQIEIVRFFDKKIPDWLRNKNEETKQQALLFEYIDLFNNVVPEGVLAKFIKKQYTDEYSKEIAIYMMGSRKQAINKIQALKQEIAENIEKLKNDYDNIHFIVHDPFLTQSIILCNKNQIKTISDIYCSTNPIKYEMVDCEEIQEDTFYFVSRENIFTGEKDFALMTGGELHQYGLLSCYH